MSMADDLLDMMPSTIYRAAFIGRDAYGVPQYGTPAAFRCRWSQKPTLVRRIGAADTQQVVASDTLWVQTTERFEPEDEIVLPDARTPPILAIEHPQEEDGSFHAKVYLG